MALFLLSFLPHFVDPERGRAWSQALVLGTLFTILGLLTDGTWAIVAGAVRSAVLRGRAMPFVRRYVAGVDLRRARPGRGTRATLRSVAVRDETVPSSVPR